MTGGILPSLDWGVRPVLFRIGSLPVSSYAFFVGLGLAVGLVVFFMEARRHSSTSENTFWILMAALVGGALGAKLLVIILRFGEIVDSFPDMTILLSGRSIVGGVAGGAIGVFALKRRLGIKERKGNIFAPAIAAGVAVGRLGCFLRGCCHGNPTQLPWGIDFGDGIARHPTQLYEALFMTLMFVAITAAKRHAKHPAVLLWLLLTLYFAFRFFNEMFRADVERLWLLTFFQWLSLVMMLVYGVRFAMLVVRREAWNDRN